LKTWEMRVTVWRSVLRQEGPSQGGPPIERDAQARQGEGAGDLELHTRIGESKRLYHGELSSHLSSPSVMKMPMHTARWLRRHQVGQGEAPSGAG
jgi:hypothetical protein